MAARLSLLQSRTGSLVHAPGRASDRVNEPHVVHQLIQLVIKRGGQRKVPQRKWSAITTPAAPNRHQPNRAAVAVTVARIVHRRVVN